MLSIPQSLCHIDWYPVDDCRRAMLNQIKLYFLTERQEMKGRQSNLYVISFFETPLNLTISFVYIFSRGFKQRISSELNGYFPQGRSQGGATGACAPPFFKKNPYFLCRIIRFYTNNPKYQYVYLSFYLNDYQIIDKLLNTIWWC